MISKVIEVGICTSSNSVSKVIEVGLLTQLPKPLVISNVIEVGILTQLLTTFVISKLILIIRFNIKHTHANEKKVIQIHQVC